MRRVFVDTGAFLGLLVPKDRSHPKAKPLFEQAARERWHLVTSNIVVIETYAVLLIRASRKDAITFLDVVLNDGYSIERVRRDDEEKAIALVRSHEDKTYSLCDALSFVVMERLGLQEAMAFDSDFRSYGRFTVLEPS